MRLEPAPRAPRRPAVPNSRVPSKRSASSVASAPPATASMSRSSSARVRSSGSSAAHARARSSRGATSIVVMGGTLLLRGGSVRFGMMVRVRSYEFRETWEVAAPVDAVRDLLLDLERYPVWWPQVVAVASLGPDDARVLCRSALPYTLDLVMHAVSRELPVLEVGLSGHLRGSVRWRLSEQTGGTGLDIAQEVTVHGPVAPFAAVLSPLARWNHGRMMAGGLAGLRRRLTEHAEHQQ